MSFEQLSYTLMTTKNIIMSHDLRMLRYIVVVAIIAVPQLHIAQVLWTVQLNDKPSRGTKVHPVLSARGLGNGVSDCILREVVICARTLSKVPCPYATIGLGDLPGEFFAWRAHTVIWLKEIEFNYYPRIKKREKNSASVFLSIFISEDYGLAHSYTL